MGYKILLADDSVTVQKIITLTFSDEGVDVLTVNNGDEAIHRLQYMRPALVMADVSIPGKNGYDICEYVKNHPDMKDTPVVLLVPAFEPFDEERARRIGADKHLTKPFQSIRTLITTVKTLLEGRPPKFATGSLNNIPAQVQAPEPPKPPVVEAAVAAPVLPIRATQPFPDEPEPETIPAAAPIQEVAEEAPAVDIWKDEPVVETEEVLEVEEVLEFQAEPVMLSPEPPAEVEPTVEESRPITEELEPIVTEPEMEPIPSVEEIGDAVTQPNVEVLDEPVAAVPEPVLAEAPSFAPPAETTVQAADTGDLDHVLDLDDVLGWPPAPQTETQIAATAAPSAAVGESVIPQSVIDEIVNRVVAQLSEKLTSQLASQLAPEVAELVKHQVQPVSETKAATNSESDSLLDLD